MSAKPPKKLPLIKKVVVLKHTFREHQFRPKAATSGGMTLSLAKAAECRRRANGRRGHALCPLHQRIDRKAQGVVHTTGGYMVGTYITTKYVFDIHDNDNLRVYRRRRLDHRP